MIQLADSTETVARQLVSPLSLSQNTSLADKVKEGRWFTTALTLTALRRPVDPLADLLRQNSYLEVSIYLHRKPLFRGLGSTTMPHWNHAVYWCQLDQWPEIQTHMAACALKDGAETTYAYWLDGMMPDLVALERPNFRPGPFGVPVAILGLTNDRWFYRLYPASDNFTPSLIQKESLQ